jgi:hypothetical protein
MANELARLNAVLGDLGRLDGIQGLRLAADGTGGMELKSGIKVLFEYVQDSGRPFVYTPLMNVPEDERQRCALFAAVLSRNFLELGVGRGSLAVFEHTAQVVYQVALGAAQVDVHRLDRTIDALLKCRGEILLGLEEGDAAQAPPAGTTAYPRAHVRGSLATKSGPRNTEREKLETFRRG